MYCCLQVCYSSIAETVFTNQLKRNLAISAPNLPATIISALEQSVTVLEDLDPSIQESVLPAYMHSIAQTFFIGVLGSALVSLCALYVKDFYSLHLIDLTITPRAVRNVSLTESPENVSESHQDLSLSRLPKRKLIA